MDISSKAIITNGDGQTPGFVISLDGIGSELLPACFIRQKDKTVPLWSPLSSGSGAEYHEFEVVIEEDGDSDDNHVTLAYSPTRCYICEVDVPYVFWEQHIRSVTHRACRLIADISLERARKMALNCPTFLNLDIPQPLGEYFCEQCFRPVAVTDRKLHVTSEEHSRSVINEQLLDSLSRLYENNENFVSVYEDIFDQKEIQNGGETSGRKDCQIQIGVNSDANSVQKQRNRTYAIVCPNSGAKLKISLDNYHGFCTNGNKTLCRVCRVTVDDKFDHEWDLEHRKKVEAAVKDKHCIRQLDNILNHCMICNEIIENTEEHILCSETHKSSLQDALIEDDKTTLAEDSYTKEVMSENLIENVAFNEEVYYCIVCQIYLLKSTLFEHVKKYAHESNMKLKPFNKKGVVNYYQKSNNKTSLTNSCNVCHTFYQWKRDLKRHYTTKEHIYNEWLSKKDSELHYHMTKSSDLEVVVCKVCYENISDKTDAINEHINSTDHQNKYDKILNDNFMRKINENEVHCELCASTDYMFDVLDHIYNKKSHRKKITFCQNAKIGLGGLKMLRQENIVEDVPCDDDKVKQLLKKNRLYDTNHLNYGCSACNRFVRKTDILDHIVSNEHKRRLNSRMDPAEDSDDGEDYFENLETMFILNSCFDSQENCNDTDHFVSHTNRDSNIPAETNKTVGESQNIKGEREDINNDQKIADESQKVADEVAETVEDFAKTVAHLYETTNIPKQHPKHTKKYETVLLENNLKEVVDSFSKKIQRYSCKACEVDVCTSELFQHVNTNRHKLYLAIKPSTSGSSQHGKEMKANLVTYQNKVEQSNISDVKKGSENKLINVIAEENSKISDTKAKNINYHFCEVCQVEVQNTIYNIKMHNDDVRHKNNLKMMEELVAPTLPLTQKDKPDIKPKAAQTVPVIANSESQTQSKIKPNLPSASVKVKISQIQPNAKPPFPSLRMQIPQEIPTPQTKIVPSLVLGLDNTKFQLQTKLGLSTESNIPTKPMSNTTKTNVANTEDLDILNVVDKDGICFVCKTNVYPINPTSIRQHINGLTHKVNLNKSSINDHQKNPPTTGSSQNIESQAKAAIYSIFQLGYCNLCKTEVCQDSSSILTHVDEKLHKQRLTESKNIPEPAELYNQLRGGSESYVNRLLTTAYCNLCKTKVPDNVSNINEHITGRTHNKNYLSHLITNLPKKESVNTPTAIANNLKESPGINKIAKQKLSRQNLSELAGVERHKETNNSSPSPLPSNNDNVCHDHDLYYECNICDVKVPNNKPNIIDHIKGKRHEQNVIRLKPANEINKEGLSDILKDSSNESGLVTNNLQANGNDSPIGIEQSKEQRKLSNERGNNTTDEKVTTENTNDDTCRHTENTNEGGKDKNMVTINAGIRSETISNVANIDKETNIAIEASSSNVTSDCYTTDNLNTGNNRDTYNAKTSDDDKIKTDNSEEKTDNEGLYVCSICNQIIPDNATEIQSHLKSCRHGIKEAEKREKEKEGLLPADVHSCKLF